MSTPTGSAANDCSFAQLFVTSQRNDRIADGGCNTVGRPGIAGLDRTRFFDGKPLIAQPAVARTRQGRFALL